MARHLRRIFYLALFAASPAAVSAQDFPFDAMRDVIHVCRADYHRVCPEVRSGDGRIGSCLAARQNELSPPCLAAVKFAYAVKVCAPDYSRFCSRLEPGDGRIVRCLADNARNLSPQCYNVVRANAPYFEDGNGDDRYASRKNGSDSNRYAYRGGRSYDEDDHPRGYDDDYDRRAYQDHQGGQPYGGQSYEDSRQHLPEASPDDDDTNGAYDDDDNDDDDGGDEPIK